LTKLFGKPSHLLACLSEQDNPDAVSWLVAGEGGLQAVLELVHLFLTQPRWEEPAMERAKQMYLSHYRSLPKSLERATADRIMAAMMGPDRCGVDAADSLLVSAQHGIIQAAEACPLHITRKRLLDELSSLQLVRPTRNLTALVHGSAGGSVTRTRRRSRR